MKFDFFLQKTPVLRLLPFQILGILIGKYFDLSVELLLPIFLLSVLLLFTKIYQWGIFSAVVIMMMLRLNTAQLQTIPFFKPDQKYEITAEVKSIKTTRYNYQIILQLLQSAYQAQVLLKIQDDLNILPGDTLIFQGSFERPQPARNPGSFDYRKYLEQNGITHIVTKDHEILDHKSGNWSLDRQYAVIKNWLSKTIEINVDPPFAGVLKGLLLGEKGEIDVAIKTRFQQIGVVHILAVSGLHVGYILLILTVISNVIRLNDSLKVIFITLGLLFYMGLTGYPPSVVRAGSMAILYVFGKYRHKKMNPWNIVGVAAFGILVWNPMELFSIAFQLSFGAVSGILYTYPKLQLLDRKIKWWQKIRRFKIIKFPTEMMMVTLGAQIGTLIPVALTFKVFPVWGFIANIFIVPLAGFAVVAGIIMLIFSLMSVTVGYFYGQTCWGILWMMNFISGWFEMLPFKSIPLGNRSIYELIAILITLILIVSIPLKRYAQKVTIAILILFSVLIWRPVLFTEPERFTFLDVGQGDAFVIETAGKTILIDAGYVGFGKDYGLYVVLPYLKHRGITKVDLAIFTHPHSDHIGGYPAILDQIKVKHIWDTFNDYDSQLYDGIKEKIEQQTITVSYPKPGDKYSIGSLELTILYPDSIQSIKAANINNASIVLRVDHGENSFLFAGDAEEETEFYLQKLGDIIDVDIIKIGHHGSKTSSTAGFVKEVTADHGIISCGEGNKFKHPSQSTIDRWDQAGTHIYRTDKNGAITILSDGEDLKISAIFENGIP